MRNLTSELKKELDNFRFLVKMERAILSEMPETLDSYKRIVSLLQALGKM